MLTSLDERKIFSHFSINSFQTYETEKETEELGKIQQATFLCIVLC